MKNMEQFSRTQKITRDNLKKVPNDKPGVYRIKSAEGEILYIGKAKGGRLDDRIWEHRGRFMTDTQFQYRITKDSKATDRLELEEIRKSILPHNRKK